MEEIRTAAVIEAELEGMADGYDEVPEEEVVKGPSQAAIDASEYEAGRKGWVPKDKYKKNPETWVDAQMFLERGDKYVANLQRDVARLTQKLEDFEGTKAAFVKFSEDALAKKDDQLKEAISALRLQRTAAIREGEDDLAVQLEDRIDLLREQRTEVKAIPKAVEATKQTPAEDDPVLQEWISEDNTWFNDEPKLRDFAIRVGERLIADGETLRGRRFLDKIRSVMEQEFPRRFQKKDLDATYRSGPESSSASASGRSDNPRTERDLPKEDLALMKEFIADGITTKEKFLKSYFSRN